MRSAAVGRIDARLLVFLARRGVAVDIEALRMREVLLHQMRDGAGQIEGVTFPDLVTVEYEILVGRAHLRGCDRVEPHGFHDGSIQGGQALHQPRFLNGSAVGEEVIDFALHAGVHLGVLENGIDAGSGGVGHGVQAGHIGRGQMQTQILGGHQRRVVAMRLHDVVDQGAVFGVPVAAQIVRLHLITQLEDALFGLAIARIQSHQEFRALPRHQAIQDVENHDADIGHVLQRGIAGDHDAELIGDHELERFEHRHGAVRLPVARDGAVGDLHQFVVTAFDRLLGIAAAQYFAQFGVLLAIHARQGALGVVFLDQTLPELARAQAFLALARVHEVGGIGPGKDGVLIAEHVDLEHGAVLPMTLQQVAQRIAGHAGDAPQ